MPLTENGKKALGQFKKHYGEKVGKGYFYASIKKGISGSKTWHKSVGKNKYTEAL